MTNVMTPKQLTRYIQTWYANVLRGEYVDIVTTSKTAAVFGFPDWRGGTNYWEFKPHANGKVAVRLVMWPENGKRKTFPWTVGPDIDGLMQLTFDGIGNGDWYGDADPNEKPATPRTTYR